MTPHSLWSFWRWAFARTYLRDKRLWGESQASVWSAITALSINMSFNLLAVVAVLAWVLHLPSHVSHPRELGLAVMVLALAANYLRFGRQGEAEELLRSLEPGSAAATRREERKLLGYTVVSFLAPVLIVVARLWLHR
ncbi:MAG: hypothetical protein ABW061_08175 [Polyangiaceae bacterium]